MNDSKKQHSHARASGEGSVNSRQLPPPEPLRLSVISRNTRPVVPFLRWYIPQVIRLCGSPLNELTVVVAHDGLMRRLHRQFFGDPTLTDVITFPLEQDQRGRALSGEIYLCISVARSQAFARKIPTRLELLLYATHGILHLSGYDDLTPRKYHIMHKEEDRILQQLGFGPVFDRAELNARSGRA